MEINFEKVYPWVKQIENNIGGNEFTVIAADGSNASVTLPWHHLIADLGVFYVADTGDSFVMLQENMLPAGIDEQALFNKARDNMLRDTEFRLCGTNWGGAGLVAGGNFEACSLCCPDIWDFVAGQLQQDIIVAVPARDVVIMSPAGDGDTVNNLKAVAKQIFEGGDHALSQHLFYYSAEKREFSVWE